MSLLCSQTCYGSPVPIKQSSDFMIGTFITTCLNSTFPATLHQNSPRSLPSPSFQACSSPSSIVRPLSTPIPAHICHLKCFPTSYTSTNYKFPPTTKPLNSIWFFFSLGGARAPSPGVQQSSCFLEDEMLCIFHACGLDFSKGCQCWYSNLPFLLSSIQCNWWQLLGLIF